MEKLSNLDFLRGFSKGDAVKMEKYIRMFLKNVPGLIEKLDSGLAAKDWSGLRVTVHSMKPQLTFMGATEASSFAQSLESDLDGGKNVVNIDSKLIKLKSMVNQVIDELTVDVENL